MKLSQRTLQQDTRGLGPLATTFIALGTVALLVFAVLIIFQKIGVPP